MGNIVETVYTNLKESTEGIAEKVSAYNKLVEMEKSGNYTAQMIQNDIRPKRYGLKNDIEKDKEAAISKANALVRAYQDELREKDNLRPEDITEDAKLFNVGVKLKPRDVEAIISRNADNPTMVQLALRYAEENGIDIGKRFYVGHQAQIREAENLLGVIHYYANWIDQDNAFRMLDKFFGIAR